MRMRDAMRGYRGPHWTVNSRHLHGYAQQGDDGALVLCAAEAEAGCPEDTGRDISAAGARSDAERAG
jgi:hypothetical protein